MRWPKYVKAQPTLRGLRLQPEKPDPDLPEAVLYPWGQVGLVYRQNGSSTWIAYDEDGHEIAPNGRKLYLHVKSARASQPARDAQERYFRRGWRERNLDIAERYSWKAALIIPIAGALACLLVIAASLWIMLPGLARRLEEGRSLALPASYPVLLVFLLIIALLPLLVRDLSLLYRSLRRPINVAAATFGPGGIRAALRDGSEMYLPWRLLAGASQSSGVHQLDFKDGTTLRMPFEPRTEVLVRVLSEQTNPNLAIQERRARRRIILRIVAYAAVGMALISALGYHLHRHYHLAGIDAAATVAVGQIGLIGTVTLAFLCRPWRRRKRGRISPRGIRRSTSG